MKSWIIFLTAILFVLFVVPCNAAIFTGIQRTTVAVNLSLNESVETPLVIEKTPIVVESSRQQVVIKNVSEEKENTTANVSVNYRTIIPENKSRVSVISLPENITVLENKSEPKTIMFDELPLEVQKEISISKVSERKIINVTKTLKSNYEYEKKENISLFGFLPISIGTKYEVDKEGKIIDEKKPWYSFLGVKKSAQEAVNAKAPDFPPALSNDIGAELKICNIDSCTGDAGSMFYLKEIKLPYGLKMQKHISFSVSSEYYKEVTGGILEVSLKPFNGEYPADTIYTQTVPSGDFSFDFVKVLSTKQTLNFSFMQNSANISGINSAFISEKKMYTNKGSDNTLNFIQPDLSFNNLAIIYPTYYLRVIPLKGSTVYGMPTNDVKVTIVAPDNSSGINLYTPVKIYEIKIKEFQPVLAPDKGVCSHAMILDTDWPCNSPGCTGILAHKGDRICPKPFMGVGEKAWYEQFWDALKSGLVWVTEHYTLIKSIIVKMVAATTCGGEPMCTKSLSVGLDIGLASMGVPPSLPNFDQFIDKGMDYLAAEMASQAGCPDILCKELVKSKLKEAFDSSKNINPACGDVAAAHDLGIEPLCLPAGVEAHWDPAATYRDASVVLEVKRNYVSADAPNSNFAYNLYMSSYGYNENPVGGWITNIEPYGESMQITDPLQGEIFEGVLIKIPPLEKGETIEIPVNLVPTDYWVPGHKEHMHGWSTVVYKDGWPQYQYDDWWMFYYGANLNMHVVIDACYYGSMSSCRISEDSMSLVLPSTLNP